VRYGGRERKILERVGYIYSKKIEVIH